MRQGPLPIDHQFVDCHAMFSQRSKLVLGGNQI